MSKEKTLIKNTIIYALGNFGSKLIGFVMLPFYTRYLNIDDYGSYDFIITTITVLIPLVTFQINDAVYRYLIDVKENSDIEKNITNAIYILLRNLIVMNVIYLLLVPVINKYDFNLLVLLMLNLQLLLDFYQQVSRGLKKSHLYSMAGIFITFSSVSLNILFLKFLNFKVSGLILSSILTNILVVIILENKIKLIKKIKIKYIDKVKMKMLTQYSIPLIPNVISWWVMNMSDRYLLRIFCGISANGIYAVANKFPTILLTINNIFSLAWQDSAIMEYNNKDRDKFYSSMFSHFMRIEFTSVIILLSITKPVMSFMIDEKFSSSAFYIPALYIGTIFWAFSSFYGTGYLSTKNTKGAFQTSILGALSNFIVNLILIPQMGIQGASISTMLAFMIMWIARLRQTRQFFKIKIEHDKLAILLILTVIYVAFYYYIENIYINILSILTAFIIFIIFNFTIVKSILKFSINLFMKVSKGIR